MVWRHALLWLFLGLPVIALAEAPAPAQQARPAWTGEPRMPEGNSADFHRGIVQARMELDEDEPIMQQLMQVQGADGQFAARPLWEAEKYIRGLDEWQYTDDAAETYASATKAVGAMFGFG